MPVRRDALRIHSPNGREMSPDQIAAVMGISRQRVDQILHNAYRKLRNDPRVRELRREAALKAGNQRVWPDWDVS